MLKLRLSFTKEDAGEQTYEITEGEYLDKIIDRILIPAKLKGSAGDSFVALVNGHIIDTEFWKSVKLKASDDVLVSPKIKGAAGQFLKSALSLTAIVVATYFFPPAASLGNAFLVAGISVATSALLNALIPPPSGAQTQTGSSVGASQMYSINGQSNQMSRNGIVPKVYGTHRLFPTLAANPYNELVQDPTTGKIVQYYNAIYDFGLGTPQIVDIRIGDTPIGNFSDVEMNLFDYNLPPEEEQDEFDEGLNNLPKTYKGDRDPSNFNIVLEPSETFTQNSATNPREDNQEIFVNFLFPEGLFGYSSDGRIGSRAIEVEVEFAPVGEEVFKKFDDASVVTESDYIGPGTTSTGRFEHRPLQINYTTHEDVFKTYYRRASTEIKKYEDQTWVTRNEYNIYFRDSGGAHPEPSRKIPFPLSTINSWRLGAGLWWQGALIGKIVGIVEVVIDGLHFCEVEVDRDLSKKFKVGRSKGVGASESHFLYVRPYQKAYALSPGKIRFQFNGSGPLYGVVRFKPISTDQLQIRVRHAGSFGDFGINPVEKISWVGIETVFDIQPINTDKRHVFMELRIKATDQLNGSIQNLSATVVQPVYKPTDETGTSWVRTVTEADNPAWVFCDLLTSEVNKKAVDRSRLHLPSLIQWSNYCLEIPTNPEAEPFFNPRFRTNFVLDFETTLQELLSNIGSAAQASLNIIDGKYGVLVDKFKDTPVQIFTPRNSKNFSSVRNYTTKPHGLKVKFIEPGINWESSEVIVYDNGYDATNSEEFEDIETFACTDFDQAWRFGRYMLAQNRLRQETISITVDFEHLICTRGDYVKFTHDVMQVGGVPSRVSSVSGIEVTIDDSIEIDPSISYGYTLRKSTGEVYTSILTPLQPDVFDFSGDLPEAGDLIIIGEVGRLTIDCVVKSISPNDDLSAQVTLVERANEIFSSESSGLLPEYDPQFSSTSQGGRFPPPAIINLVSEVLETEPNDGETDYLYPVFISWNTPQNSVHEMFEIYINEGLGEGFKLHSNTEALSFKYYANPAALGFEHSVKVLAVSATGSKLTLVDAMTSTFTPIDDAVLPGDIQNFAMSITNQVLQLSWDKLTAWDIVRYEIRYTPNTSGVWESAITLQTVDRHTDSLAVQARTGTYMIKGLDRKGNKSLNAVSVITTIPNLFDLNIIEEINDAPTFAGALQQAVLFPGGGSVMISKQVEGGVDSAVYYSEGFYTLNELVDLGDIFTARVQSLIKADGFRAGDLMSEWTELSEVEELAAADSDDWAALLQYRSSNELITMSSWSQLLDVEHIFEGDVDLFTPWRPVPTLGDATGRVFQFRVQLMSKKANVTPRLFDTTVRVDMPDRQDSFENLTSHASNATTVTYTTPFHGPGTTPNIQISIDNAQTGDYWSFPTKTLEGFTIRFYNSSNTQVVRQFDVLAKGYGRLHTVVI